MEMRKGNTVIYYLVLLLLFTQMKANAQEGADLFTKTCKACHSIGGGRLVGPDLKGITARRSNDWLVSFIQSSVKKIKSGDADAAAIAKEYNNMLMPDVALAPVQINLILTHIDGDNAAAPKIDKMQLWTDSLLKANSPYDIDKGYQLFSGNLRLENGGVACVSCHNVTLGNKSSGGLLAKDLTKVFSRLAGVAGIKAVVAAPPFPAMTEAYKISPVTGEENAYLQLFLKNADSRLLTAPPADKAFLLYSGIFGALALVLAISLIWIKRKRRSVNHLILKRQEKYSI
jgi:mono/diheme cytochrome c family protein